MVEIHPIMCFFSAAAAPPFLPACSNYSRASEYEQVQESCSHMLTPLSSFPVQLHINSVSVLYFLAQWLSLNRLLGTFIPFYSCLHFGWIKTFQKSDWISSCQLINHSLSPLNIPGISLVKFIAPSHSETQVPEGWWELPWVLSTEPTLYPGKEKTKHVFVWVAQQVVTVFHVRGKMLGYWWNWRRWGSWPGRKNALNTRCWLLSYSDLEGGHSVPCYFSAYSWQSLHWHYRTQKSSSGKPLLLKRREFECQMLN